MKEIMLLISIISMMTLGFSTVIQAADDNNNAKSAGGSRSSESNGDDQTGPSPEDEGDDQSRDKEKEKKSAGGDSVPPDATLTSEASAASAVSPSASMGVYGDFNNDGFDDLAIGVPYEDVDNIVDAGAVNVLYGSATGLQAVSPGNQYWHQDELGVEEVPEAGDLFGSSLATGDFNNDGMDDLAIGVPFEDIRRGSKGPVVGAGAVNVLYGSATGLQTASPLDQFWNQNSADVDDVAEFGDLFGSSLATGDFNNDGRDDLAIGVLYEDVDSIANAGAVNVLYGSATGLQTASPLDQFWNQDSPDVIGTANGGDAFGSSLATGDFNNDGMDDLAIGVYADDIFGLLDAGAVNVLYGSASGLQTGAPADQFWNQNSEDVDGDAWINDFFGWSLAAGDFNNDGMDDLAIGVLYEDVDNRGSTGAVNVLYGSAAGLQAVSPGDQYWHQDSLGVDDDPEAFDLFGWSLATGDFNNDGMDDLAIGVYGEGVAAGPVTYAGAVNVLYGSATGLQTSAPADQFWNQNSVDVDDVAEAYDRFGYSLATGDFNNDGMDDLAIGVPFEDVGAGPVIDAGAVNVLYGSATGLQTSAPADQFWTQDSMDVVGIAEPGDRFGNALA